MKKRDLSLDIIRILAIISIVIFHYAGTRNTGGGIFLFYANGTVGSLGTAVFFILSGYLLQKNHHKIDSVFSFYKKRWISIFPAFYIAFFVAFLINAIRLGSLFYRGHAYSLVYTLLGIDNLVSWFGVTTYAIVGEWFSGIIILLYILFPLLNRLMRLNKWSVTVIFSIFYVIYNVREWYPLIPDISLVSCGFVFWIGMLVAEYDESVRKSYITGVVSLVMAILMLCVSIPVPEVFANHLTALLLFVAGIVLLKSISGGGKAIGYLSGLSYSVYLVHHYIANVLVMFEDKYGYVDKVSEITRACGYFLLVAVSSVALDYLSHKIVSVFTTGKVKKTS